MVVSVFGKKVRLPRGEEKLKIEYIGEIRETTDFEIAI